METTIENTTTVRTDSGLYRIVEKSYGYEIQAWHDYKKNSFKGFAGITCVKTLELANAWIDKQ